jgi:SAM-dependent methyltransferase
VSDIESWIEKQAYLVDSNHTVLDLACGGGRHARYFAEKGCHVTAVDRDLTKIRAQGSEKITVLEADLESDDWPFSDASFDCIVVVNYLWRPLFPVLKAAIKPGGHLIYSTFAIGNEAYGRPSNPHFLLTTGELKTAFSDLDILDFEEGYRASPKPAVRQSIVACKA